MAPELDTEACFLCEMGSFPEPRRECVCVSATMNYGSQWKRGLWIMLMKSAAITQTSFDRTFQSRFHFLALVD